MSSLQLPALSVVIPTYNRAPLLRRTLVSLVEQRNAPPFEVIVADDGSADDSQQVTAEFRDRLAIRYCHQEDKGYRAAKARNMGAAVASAPILMFLDSGTLAGPDLLAGHLRLRPTIRARHRRCRGRSQLPVGPSPASPAGNTRSDTPLACISSGRSTPTRVSSIEAEVERLRQVQVPGSRRRWFASGQRRGARR